MRKDTNLIYWPSPWPYKSQAGNSVHADKFAEALRSALYHEQINNGSLQHKENKIRMQLFVYSNYEKKVFQFCRVIFMW